MGDSVVTRVQIPCVCVLVENLRDWFCASCDISVALGLNTVSRVDRRVPQGLVLCLRVTEYKGNWYRTCVWQ